MKTALITGGNRGLGLGCARCILALPGWQVVIACRDIGAANHAVASLAARSDASRIALRSLDLASLASIRAFAADPPDELHALVCNAGIQHLGPAIVRTQDGVEASFGVNYLGHFLLANLLLPHFTRPARLVFVSSGTHDPKQRTGMPAPIFTNAHDLAFPPPDADKSTQAQRRRYTTSKLCMIYCVHEMHARLRAAGISDISVNAMDPGMMPGTGLARDYPRWMRLVWTYFMPALRLVMRNVNSVGASAANLAALATGPAFEGLSGRYFEGQREIRSSDLSYDEANADDLWVESCKLTGPPEDPVAAAFQ